jgi:acyl-CoA thioesterase II
VLGWHHQDVIVFARGPVRLMREKLRVLVDDILGLERIEVDIFRGRSPQGATQRVFGGQVAAQALAAALRTAPTDRYVHSLHAYFLRPGDPAVPIVYTVDRLRDGRTFTTRRVVGVQHGRPIFTTSVQLAIREEGLEHSGRMPEAPDPESVPAQEVIQVPRADGTLAPWAWGESLEMRFARGGPSSRPDDEARQQVWFRTIDRLPDDEVLHAAVLTYASDMSLLGVTLAPHTQDLKNGARSGLQVGSLDHAVWFHASARPDEWLLYDQVSPWAGHARGLARGTIWTRGGTLVATVVQEGLIRPIRPTS